MDVNATAFPVPVRLITCGLLLAPSVIVIAPVLVPAAVGENVMLIVHFVFAASDVPHVFVSPKSPDATILVMATLTDSLFVKFAVLALLVEPTNVPPNVMLEGNAVIANTPVPVKLTVCGLPLALSENVNVPLTVPATVGVNVTLVVHFAPAATELPHVFVCE